MECSYLGRHRRLFRGWLATGSWKGSVLQIIEIVIGVFVYYPFIKILDKQYLEEERKAEEKNLEINFGEV